MSAVPNADLPGVLEALLRAEADFGRRLLAAGPLPDRETWDQQQQAIREQEEKGVREQQKNTRRSYVGLVDDYEKFMPSGEVMVIARLLYMLDACGVADGEALRRLIAAHNERVAALAMDKDYIVRMGVSRGQLLEAVFPDGWVDHVAKNFDRHGRAALDAKSMGRLLVEFAGRHQISDAMRLLAEVGFFETAPPNEDRRDAAAKVYVSDGRLEAVYRDYLADVARGVGAALSARPEADARPPRRGRAAPPKGAGSGAGDVRVDASENSAVPAKQGHGPCRARPRRGFGVVEAGRDA